MPSDNMHENVNRLVNEQSPYLQQHAYNPVDWFPWSEEAFEKAKKEDKPIFLSIGYSTCHWCHVMERESFEDREVAQILNEYFVSIKVDREERPDIDTIYMSACQAMTGQGGWPLTVFLDTDKKPFYAGTYFPKSSKLGRPGLTDLLTKVSSLWQEDRDKLLTIGEDIIQAIDQHFYTHSTGSVTKDIVQKGYTQLKQQFDNQYGGFGDAPKFPTPQNLYFLLRHWKLTGEKEALNMVEKTLTSMYRGGIYDHIGFGFSRYSTDKKWLVPHFEKMLYDNALLALAFLETYQVTGSYFYRRVAEEVFTYVLRDMRSPEGGFYSAEDADSEGEEGKYYVFTPKEIKEVLGEQRGKDFCQTFNISEDGNFEGKSIPNLINSDISIDENFFQQYQQDKQLIFDYRKQRVHPFKDDKILTSWNGLMIAALAKGGRVLGNDEYTEAARSAFRFIEKNLVRDDGRLLARYRNKEATISGFLDDYAYLIWGLLEMYHTTFEPEFLEKALNFHHDMIDLFWDEKNHGLFLSGKDSEQLVARPKEVQDGALPSGNSVATKNMLELYFLTADSNLLNLAEKQINAFGGSIKEIPLAYTHFLSGVFLTMISTEEVTLVTDSMEASKTQELLQTLMKGFYPERFILIKQVNGSDNKLTDISDLAVDRDMKDGKPTVYLCKDFTCLAPMHEPEELP